MKSSKKFMLMLTLITSMQLSARENKQQIFIANDYGRDIAASLVWEWKKGKLVYYRYQDLFIPKDMPKFMVKAPVSGYKLVSMDVTPSANAWGKKTISEISNYMTKGLMAAGAIAGAVTVTKIAAAPMTGALVASGYGGTIASTGAYYAMTSAAPFVLAGVAVAGFTELGYYMAKSGNHHKTKAGKDNYFVIEHTDYNSEKAGQKQVTIKKYSSESSFEKEDSKVLSPSEQLASSEEVAAE